MGKVERIHKDTRLPVTVWTMWSRIVGDDVICALSVEYHMQRSGYIGTRSYLYVVGAGLNKHDNLLRLLLLSRKSHHA